MRIAEVPSKPRSVLGTFSKAVPGAAALNMGGSGGKNCSRACAMHPESESPFAVPGAGRCYAATIESGFKGRNVKAKLDRIEETDPDEVVYQADAELRQRRYRLPWFRLSAFGSVPDRIPAGFVKMLQALHDADTPIHFPIEDPDRVERYRDALPDSIAVRLSIPTGDTRSWIDYSGACSTVAGSMEDSPMERIQDARDVASNRRQATERRVIVCPAVASTTYRRKGRNVSKVHCGECTACADPATDVVYPVHA